MEGVKVEGVEGVEVGNSQICNSAGRGVGLQITMHRVRVQQSTSGDQCWAKSHCKR